MTALRVDSSSCPVSTWNRGNRFLENLLPRCESILSVNCHFCFVALHPLLGESKRAQRLRNFRKIER